MDAVFKKLNLKNQKEVVVLNAPQSFQVNLDSIAGEVSIINSLQNLQEIEFILIFVSKQSEIDALIPLTAPLLKGDALLWMCYPKELPKNTNAILIVTRAGRSWVPTIWNLSEWLQSMKIGVH